MKQVFEVFSVAKGSWPFLCFWWCNTKKAENQACLP